MTITIKEGGKMPYNSKNHEMKVAFIMRHYEEWKAKNADIPDTFFVYRILPKLGYPMSYSAFMKGYKHRGKVREVKGQMSLF